MSGRDGELARVIPFPGGLGSSMASPGSVAVPSVPASHGLREAAPGATRGAARPAPRVARRAATVARPGRVRGCSGGTARGGRIRLTRRGRFVVVATVLLAVGAAGVSGATLGSLVGDSVPERTSSVQVQPGETLWGIAQRVDADADVREVMRRIAELNGLAEGETISPGQRLTVPSDR